MSKMPKSKAVTHTILPDAIQIHLTNGYVAYIDLEDIALAQRCWFAAPNGRKMTAVRSEGRANRGTRLLLHKQVTGAKPGDIVRPRDGDYLNCRRSNLEVITRSQFAATSPKRGSSTDTVKSSTGIRGVSIKRDRRRGTLAYGVGVMRNGKRFQRTFPFTDDGLKAAAIAADEMRQMLEGGPSHSSV